PRAASARGVRTRDAHRRQRAARAARTPDRRDRGGAPRDTAIALRMDGSAGAARPRVLRAHDPVAARRRPRATACDPVALRVGTATWLVRARARAHPRLVRRTRDRREATAMALRPDRFIRGAHDAAGALRP